RLQVRLEEQTKQLEKLKLDKVADRPGVEAQPDEESERDTGHLDRSPAQLPADQVPPSGT
ncbi:MAG: hypothetical protein ACKO9B_01555, partial [Planctomycetota bacterium]